MKGLKRTIPLIINQTSTNIKLDTGTRGNFMNEADLLKMWIVPCSDDNDYNLTDNHSRANKTLEPCNLQAEVNAHIFTVKFAIVEIHMRSLPGAAANESLQLVQQLYDTGTEYTDTDIADSAYRDGEDTDISYRPMVHMAVIDAKSVQAPEKESTNQAITRQTATYRKVSAERVVDQGDTGVVESVKQ
ncbi:hypothetical protein scyTo_0000164 [Scyliorhinus torazame]|uniref:Uncharacterized protein n=1 Tax=Scyliorhinus torazame TaxID=75743 RepID=A0A401NRN2_SCYTO|nr:hypothetical protein [Scyliorhinus torazame]